MYFVTICTYERTCILGHIEEDSVLPTTIGSLVIDAWHSLPKRFPYVALDAFTIMPNHVHGLIQILHHDSAQTGFTTLDDRKPLGRLVATFKTVATQRINDHRRTPARPVWQRGFYDHVVRNEESLARIREYIIANPLRWGLDEENPEYRHSQSR